MSRGGGAGKSSPLYHSALTGGIQEEAGGLGELAVFRITKGVDGPGAEAVVAAGGRLQGDLHWLAMGGDWESRLFGEIAGAVGRPAVRTGQGWGGYTWDPCLFFPCITV